MKKAIIIICASVMMLFVAVNEAKPVRKFPAIVFRLGHEGPNAEKIEGELRRLMQSASPKEAALYRRVKALLQKMKKPEATKMDGLLMEYFEILMEASRIWRHDGEAQAAIASSLLLLADLARRSVGPMQRKHMKLDEKSAAFVENYYRRNLNRAAAHAVKAQLCRDRKPGGIKCVRHYIRCLELDATHKFCGLAYNQIIKQYRQARCSGAVLGPVRLVPLIEAKSSSPPPIIKDAQGRRFRRANLPEIKGDEIEFLVESDARTTYLRLMPKGLRKLISVTERLSRLSGNLAVMRGDEILANPRVRRQLVTPNLLIPVPIRKVCPGAKRRKVPAKYLLPKRK